GGADPLSLPSEGGEIQIGFENLVLAPLRLDRSGGADLAELVVEAARARPRQLGRQEAGQLHGDRARAAGVAPAHARPERAAEPVPIHSAVACEALILGRHHRLAHRGCDMVQGHPFQPPYLEVDPDRLEERAVAVAKPRLARPPARAGFGIRRHGRRRGPDDEGSEGGQQSDEPQSRPPPKPAQAGPDHGRTSSGRLGSAAWISGEYIASTRVGGSWNRPALLIRAAYSTLVRPLGIQPK